MTDTQTRGMDIAPDVLDTIVALALKDVEGVAVVGQTSTGILSFFGSKQDQKGVRVSQVTSDTIDVSVSITVLNGFSLDKIAQMRARLSLMPSSRRLAIPSIASIFMSTVSSSRISTRSWLKNINMTEARRAVLGLASPLSGRDPRDRPPTIIEEEGSSMKRSFWVTMLAA